MLICLYFFFQFRIKRNHQKWLPLLRENRFISFYCLGYEPFLYSSFLTFCFVLFAAYHGALLQYFLLELQESLLNLSFIEEKGKEVSKGLLSSKSEQKNINPSSGRNYTTSMLASDYCKQKKCGLTCSWTINACKKSAFLILSSLES